MNEVKVIKVFGYDLTDLNIEINKSLELFNEDNFKLVNVQLVDGSLALIILQSKY